MPKPKSEEACNIGEFWKVRAVIAGNIIHLASRTEPRVHHASGRVVAVDLDLIQGTEHGDTVGFIDWSAANAVTWRKA